MTALVQLLGPAVRVAAMARDDGAKRLIHAGPRQGEHFAVGVPTHVAATIELASGVIATLVASFDVAATRHRNIEVYGMDGFDEYGIRAFELLIWTHDEEELLESTWSDERRNAPDRKPNRAPPHHRFTSSGGSR